MSFLAQTDTLSRAEGDAADLQAAVAEPDERSYPSIPGAVREIPDWMARNAPFDVAMYFKPLPPGDNAAPLYLEAIYEFYPTEMWNCVSPAERAARGPALAERLGRTGRLQVQAQGSVSAAQRRRNVLEYRDSFDKLAAAQKRPRCAFETGLDMNARLPHAQSSRQVVRMLNWRVEMWVAQGEPDRALDDVEMALRLSRDLRPRGPAISQLVSVAIDSMTLGDIVPRILNAPALEPADCDRLRDILARHESQAVDPLGEAFRVEYLMLRDLVHRLELKDDLGALFGKPGVSNGEILANELGQGPSEPGAAEELDALLDQMTPDDFAAEIEALNRCFRPLIEGKLPRVAEMPALLERQARLAAELKVVRRQLGWLPTFFEAVRRDRTRLAGATCLVALARWRLVHPDEPAPDLATVCKEAGLKTIPIDPYSESGEPLGSTKFGEELVIYSIAGDGEDNEAQLDWKFGQSNGDWIFRLSPRAAD